MRKLIILVLLFVVSFGSSIVLSISKEDSKSNVTMDYEDPDFPEFINSIGRG